MVTAATMLRPRPVSNPGVAARSAGPRDTRRGDNLGLHPTSVVIIHARRRRGPARPGRRSHAFTGGVERQIDTAEVNGRLFLNNVSLGIYGEAVRSPAYRDAKARTLLEIAAEVMGPSAEAPAMCLVDDQGREHHHLAVVLVSNNPYALDRPLIGGTRPALDSGQLGIVVLDAPGDSPHSPGQAWTAPRLEVNAPAPVHAGVDGEAVDLSPPLRFAIRPAALRVRICSRHPGASPSARLHLPGYPPA